MKKKLFTLLFLGIAFVGNPFLNTNYEVLAVENNKIDPINKDSEDYKNKINSLKANMHTFQTMIETHGVDFKGFYPYTIQDLKKEAESYEYWKILTNPFDIEKDSTTLISYSTYLDLRNKKDILKGSVVYKPMDCENDKYTDRNFCKNYKIYALDENGNMIKSKDKLFVLSNL